jgi:hypothetical protein
MTEDVWKDRRRALEESFFQKRDRELLERMRKEANAKQEKEALAAACGITDQAVLENLVKANITSETMAALSLVPLVLVAWADGNLAEREREAVLAAAQTEGVSAGSVPYQLLERWLQDPPEPELFQAWKDYIHLLHQQFTPEAYETLRTDILGRARNVAKSAGGVLGMSSISGEERDMLKEIEAAFAA